MSAAKKLPPHSESNLHKEAEEARLQEMAMLMDDEAPKHEDSEGIWLLSYADMMTLLMGFFALMTAMASFDNQKFEEVSKGTAEHFGGEVDQTYEKLGKELEELIKAQGLEDKVKISVKRTEVAVTFEGTLFFDSGSVALKDSAQSLMDQIIMLLSQKASDNKFLIEGHTDDIPISSGLIASNWELSSLRAAAVARLFEGQGFDREHIMTIGWGETRPLVPNRSPKGQPLVDNQAKNRRVIMKVMKDFPL